MTLPVLATMMAMTPREGIPPMTEQNVHLLQPEGLVRSPAFSHVAVIPPGSTIVVVGGQNAVDADGTLVGGDDLVAQVVRVFDNLEVALAAAGAGLEHVVHWSIDAKEGTDANAAFGAVAPRLAGLSAPPTISVRFVSDVGVPGALCEVTALAAIPPA
jgi:enamine deaminase RidA (YjgF/YER057c/UK114 family)